MNNKKIVFDVTKKYMKLNRRRTAVSFIGILFMTALMTCVFVGRTTVMNYLEQAASLNKGSWHIIAYDLSSECADRVSRMDEVENIGYSYSFGQTEFAASVNPEKPFLNVKSYSQECFDMLNITAVSGRLPQNENELVISVNAVNDNADFSIGDTVDAEFFSRTITGTSQKVTSAFPHYNMETEYNNPQTVPVDFPDYGNTDTFTMQKNYTGLKSTYTIVGTIAAPYFESDGGPNYTAFTLNDGNIINAGEKVNAIVRLDLDKVDSTYEFIMSTGEETEYETNEMLLAMSAKSGDSAITAISVFIQVFFIVLIMAASLILIYNVFNMSFSERLRYLGMLSSVGATRRQKRFSIYYEAFILLIASLPLGILLGFGIIKAGTSLLRPYLDSLIASFEVGMEKTAQLSIHFSVKEIILVIAASFVTVLVSSLIPAFKIGKIPPVESIKGKTEKKSKKSRTHMSLLKKGKSEMLLAKSSIKGSRHLSRGIVRSIAVFLALTAITAFGAGAVNKIVDRKTSENELMINADEYKYFLTGIGTDSSSDEELINMMNESSAVTDKYSVRIAGFGYITFHSDLLSDEYWKAYEKLVRKAYEGEEISDYLLDFDSEIVHMECIIYDEEEYRSLAKRCGADMDIVNSGEPSLIFVNELSVTSEYNSFGPDHPLPFMNYDLEKPFAKKTGDKVTAYIWNTDEEKNIECSVAAAGFCKADDLKEHYTLKPYHPFCIINESAFAVFKESFASQEHLEGLADETILFSVSDDENGKAFIDKVSAFCESSKGAYTVGYSSMMSGKSLKETIAGIIRILSVCFTILISVICLLNLYNSIKARAAERRSETAVLRSVGITEKQLGKMLMYENAMLIFRGTLIAAVVSAVAILVIKHFIDGYLGHFALSLPWLCIAVTFAVAVSASALITKICYRQNMKETLIEEIRKETV